MHLPQDPGRCGRNVQSVPLKSLFFSIDLVTSRGSPARQVANKPMKWSPAQHCVVWLCCLRSAGPDRATDVAKAICQPHIFVNRLFYHSYLLASNNTFRKKGNCLQVLLTSALARLRAQDVHCHPCKMSPYCLRMAQATNITVMARTEQQLYARVFKRVIKTTNY